MGLGRRVLIVLVLAACVLAAAVGIRMGAAQGGAQSGANKETFSLFDRKETLYFWYSDSSLTDFINSAAVSFGSERNVRVIPVLTEESEYLEAVNEASLHTDKTPDVYLLSNEFLEKAYLAGLADPVPKGDRFCTAANFPQAALSAVTYHGRITAYPFSFETSALVYNRTYLQQWVSQQVQKDLSGAGEGEGGEDGEAVPGEGWLSAAERSAMSEQELTDYYEGRFVPGTVEDILVIGDTFDAPEGVESIMKWDVSDIFYNYWFVGKYMIVGGDCGDDAENVDIDNPQTRECLEAYKALNQFFSIESATVDFDSVVQDFIDGKVVFTIATSDVIEKLESAKKEGTFGFDYGIACVPEVSASLESRPLSVTTAVAVNGYSKHRELAHEFAAYLAGEGSRDLYGQTQKIPARLSAAADNENVRAFKEAYADSVPLVKMMSAGNFWVELEVLFSKVWNGGDIPQLLEGLSEALHS